MKNLRRKNSRILWRAMGACAIIALIGLAMTGCDNGSGPGETTPDADFTGIWVGTIPGMGAITVTINADGTWSSTGPGAGSGTYTVNGNTATFREGSNVASTAVKVNDDTIRVTSTDMPGSPFNLTRQQGGGTVPQPAGTFRVTFNTHGGLPVPLPQDIREVQASWARASLPSPAPTREGYTLNGWFTAETEGTQFDFANTQITGNITLHAQWTAVGPASFTVSFDADGGKPEPDDQPVPAGGFATEPNPAPTKDGYNLVGWFAPSATEAFAFATTPITANITLTAQWTAVGPASFTVSFNAAGGTPEPDDQIVEAGGFATEPNPAPTRTSHTFDGWFAPNTTIAFAFATTPITADITLTARWTEVFTVGFDADGGEPEPDDQLVTAGGFAIAPDPAPTRTGHRFDGWFAPNATTAFAFATAPITANITLTARWTETFTVSFNANSGTPEPDDQIVEANGFATAPEPAPTRTSYTFAGWFAPDADMPFAFAATAITANITLTARWAAPGEWIAIPSGIGGSTTTAGITAVAYGNGRWVAVMNDGTMAHSGDGISWTAIPNGPDGSTFTSAQPISAVAFGGGRWIAGGVQGRVAYSADGINWTSSNVFEDTTLAMHLRATINGVAYGNGRWVAVLNNSWMAHSDDGIDWTHDRPGNNSNNNNGIAYSNGMWVAVGDGARLAHSADGIDWTNVTNTFIGTGSPANRITAIAFGNGRWVAVGARGHMAHSADGINWTPIPNEPGGAFYTTQWLAVNVNLITSVAYGNGRWVAVGAFGRMAYSENGIDWTAIPAGPDGSTFTSTQTIVDVAYGNGMWVAVGSNGRMAYSIKAGD